MKKLILILFIHIGVFNMLKAQSVRETRLNVLESDRLAWSIEFNFEQKVLQDAWNKKATELNIKNKPTKGLDLYATSLVPDVHFEPIDIYVKIDKLDKVRSSITWSFSKGTTNFITTEDAKIVQNINHFLDKFITYAEQYKLALDIKDQEDAIKKASKENEKLIEEGKRLQEQIDKNKIDQENKLKEIEALNQGLEKLKLLVK